MSEFRGDIYTHFHITHRALPPLENNVLLSRRYSSEDTLNTLLLCCYATSSCCSIKKKEKDSTPISAGYQVHDFTQCCVEAPSAAVPASGLLGCDATFSVARGALVLRTGGSSFDSWLDFCSNVRQVCVKHRKHDRETLKAPRAKGQGSAVKELLRRKGENKQSTSISRDLGFGRCWSPSSHWRTDKNAV